jgi:cation transport protein ChaC
MSKASYDIWIFAYGSLMWRPGFAFSEATRARLHGHSRHFCVTSVHHRGTPQRPGLVLGLDRGGSCEGIAYRVDGAAAAGVLAYLRAREQVNGVYREASVGIEIGAPQRREQTAVVYLVERAHPSYAGRLPLDVQARLIAGARGRSGANLDYFVNTLRHMAEIGIRERELERLMVVIGSYFAREPDGKPHLHSGEALRRWKQWDGAACEWLVRLRPGERRRFLYRQRLGQTTARQ